MTGVILMYHRVADAPDDPYGLAVAPDHFAAHVDHLRRRGGVVPLTEILRPSRALQVAITFDDGYVDNLTCAAPLLADAGLPATYFITSGRVGGQHFWWDRLALGLLGDHPRPSGVDVSVAGQNLWLSLDTRDARLTSLMFLHRRLRPLPPAELLSTVDAILHQLQAPTPPENARTMTTAQLQALSLLPGADIGAHTRTHLQLRDQSRRLQEEEISGSVADLTAALGRPVTSFAYPFGSRSAVGDLAPRLTRQAGCLLACTTDPGPVAARPDSQRLPRLNVQDWTAGELAAQIDRMADRG
jgi:peptidoglycan/xylan/chitin deacetylase (PgdA/CDA1 family)